MAKFLWLHANDKLLTRLITVKWNLKLTWYFLFSNRSICCVCRRFQVGLSVTLIYRYVNLCTAFLIKIAVRNLTLLSCGTHRGQRERINSFIKHTDNTTTYSRQDADGARTTDSNTRRLRGREQQWCRPAAAPPHTLTCSKSQLGVSWDLWVEKKQHTKWMPIIFMQKQRKLGGLLVSR